MIFILLEGHQLCESKTAGIPKDTSKLSATSTLQGYQYCMQVYGGPIYLCVGALTVAPKPKGICITEGASP